MHIGRTVKVFTAEPLLSPVPADETPTDPRPEPAPATPVAAPNPAPPARTPATAAR